MLVCYYWLVCAPGQLQIHVKHLKTKRQTDYFQSSKPEVDRTWKPKQMVGTTLNIEAHELTLKKQTHTLIDAHNSTAVYNEKPVINTQPEMHPLKTVLLTLGCAPE